MSSYVSGCLFASAHIALLQGDRDIAVLLGAGGLVAAL